MVFKLNLSNYEILKKEEFERQKKIKVEHIPKIFNEDYLIRVLRDNNFKIEVGDVLKIKRTNEKYDFKEIINES